MDTEFEVRDPLGSYVVRVLAEQPDPPRTIRTGGVLQAVLKMPASVLAIGSAVFLLFTAALAFAHHGATIFSGKSVSDEIMVGAVLVSGLLLLLWVGHRVVQIRTALRVGVRADSEILYIRVFLERSLNPIEDRWVQEYGRAVGRRRIALGSQLIEQEFALDRPWLYRVQPGSHVEVLVHPVSHKVLLDVRLIADSPPMAGNSS